MEIENTSLQEFRTRPGGFSEIKKKLITRSAIFILPFIAIGIWAGMGSAKWSTAGPVLLIVIPLLLVYNGFSFYRMLRRQQALFESYRVTITNEGIIRDQASTPVIMIRMADIKGITKMKNGTLCVKGPRFSDRIWIPAQMENYDQLVQSLNAISPLAPEKELTKRLILIFSALLLVLGLFYILNTTKNKFLVVISGIGLVGVFVYSMVSIQQSRHLDQRTKNRSWFVLFIILMILVTMVMKLIAK